VPIGRNKVVQAGENARAFSRTRMNFFMGRTSEGPRDGIGFDTQAVKADRALSMTWTKERAGFVVPAATGRVTAHWLFRRAAKETCERFGVWLAVMAFPSGGSV
jgi:hypothetical protein